MDGFDHTTLHAWMQRCGVESDRGTIRAMTAAASDVGLGTLYERWAVYERLRLWRRGATSALEGPVDGMAGMPGLHLLDLAKAGLDVTVVHADPEARERVRRVYAAAGIEQRLQLRAQLPDERFDLVVGFNFATHVPDWRAHLDALATRCGGALIVFATHPASYGAWTRRALRRIEPGPSRDELFDHESCRPAVMREALGRHGRVREEAFVDCPWWPDLFVSPGQTLLSASFARFRGGSGRASTRWDFGPDDYPFAAPSLPDRVRAALARHPGFDRAPGAIASMFAHHRAYRAIVG